MSIPPWLNCYVGTKYIDGGRDQSTGLDCYGLVRTILAERFGVILPRYGKDILDEDCLQEYYSERSYTVDFKQIDPRDIDRAVILYIREPGNSPHIALAISRSLMIHTTSSTGCVVESFLSSKYKDRIEEAYCVNTRNV